MNELDLELSESDFFESVPEIVIVPVAEPIRQIYSLFDHSPEFIIDQAIEACMSRASAHANIANFAMRLANQLEALEERRRGDRHLTEWRNPDAFVRLSDRLITIEQATFEIQRQLELYKLYNPIGFLPYRFEHVLGDGSLVLKRCESKEEFFDRLSFTLYAPIRA